MATLVLGVPLDTVVPLGSWEILDLEEARVTEETRVQQVQGWMDLLGTRGPKGLKVCLASAKMVKMVLMVSLAFLVILAFLELLVLREPQGSVTPQPAKELC